jgi:hypothetical protein
VPLPAETGHVYYAEREVNGIMYRVINASYNGTHCSIVDSTGLQMTCRPTK